ncbi:MAG: AIPR family protein [Nitrososphaera sp.]|nr:AIPR family protein [Nitrososphaera sp.]
MRAATINKFVSQTEIDQIYSALSPTLGGRKENYFGVLYLSKKFNIPESEAASFVAIEGTTDAGIDAYYHDKDKKTLYMYVFRWSEDHIQFREPLEKLGRSGISRIFFDPTKSENDHALIISLKTCLFENWKTIDRVVIDFVFNGDPVDAEQSKVLGFLREAVEDKRGFIESYLSRIGESVGLHDLIFHYVSNVNSLGNITSSRQTAEYVINFDGPLTVPLVRDATDNTTIRNQMRVTFLSLSDLYRMYSDLGERFFEKNLRSGLDEGKMTNVQIRNSLRTIINGEEDPQNFALYHNGITLTAQILEVNGASTVRMVEPRILNGAQTVKILKQFVDQESQRQLQTQQKGKKKLKGEAAPADDGQQVKGVDENSSSGTIHDNNRLLATTTTSAPASLQRKLAETKVMARIIQSNDEDFLKRVTINNNRQNPIMPWNLRANDLVQISFEEMFGKLGIYYERRENAYRNVMEEDIEGYFDGEKGVIEIRKFAQTLLAARGQIDRISEMKEVFESETWYRDTFREQYLSADPRQLVLLYKVQFRLQSVIREIRSVGADKYGYAPKAKNLIWCLTLQGLMNDNKFEKLVENYGNAIGVEAGFTEMLKKMASSKIRFILSDAFDTKRYRDQMAEGKFSFLKSKATLADCMRVAHSRFGWEKMSL